MCSWIDFLQKFFLQRFKWFLALKIYFENQILALFEGYFWPFNKSHEKKQCHFCDQCNHSINLKCFHQIPFTWWKTYKGEEEEEEEISQDLPSFKSVIFKGNNSVVQSLETQGNKNIFFDAEKGQYVNVDNFAFTEDIGNYFETKSQSDGGSSSLALLDSRWFIKGYCHLVGCSLICCLRT